MMLGAPGPAVAPTLADLRRAAVADSHLSETLTGGRRRARGILAGSERCAGRGMGTREA